MTGADYLVVVADQAARRGEPYAAEFRDMIETAILAPDDNPAPTLLEAIVVRPLRDHEAVAGIVGAALHLAVKNRDLESADELIMNGLRLLAKWPDYLEALNASGGAERLREGEAIRVVARRSRDLAAATGLKDTEIAAEIISRRITPEDWAREHDIDPTTWWPDADTDLTGRPFGNHEEPETEVNAAIAAKQDRLDRIEAVLATLDDPTDPRVQKLQEERHHLRTFFWLARGGDQSGQPFPNPSQDMSVEEIDILAKLRALGDMP